MEKVEEEDERREAALASTPSLQPDFKLTALKQSQLSKFQVFFSITPFLNNLIFLSNFIIVYLRMDRFFFFWYFIVVFSIFIIGFLALLISYLYDKFVIIVIEFYLTRIM